MKSLNQFVFGQLYSLYVSISVFDLDIGIEFDLQKQNQVVAKNDPNMPNLNQNKFEFSFAFMFESSLEGG